MKKHFCSYLNVSSVGTRCCSQSICLVFRLNREFLQQMKESVIKMTVRWQWKCKSHCNFSNRTIPMGKICLVACHQYLSLLLSLYILFASLIESSDVTDANAFVHINGECHNRMVFILAREKNAHIFAI